MEGAQIPMDDGNAVTSAAFASKFRSKRGKYSMALTRFFVELFTFLTVDVKAYMPPMNTLTVYFMKDLIEGKKSFVPMSRVVHAHCPAYENMKLQDIFNEFLKHTAVLNFLPDDKELRKTPKQWIVNVGASVIGEPFIAWIGEKIKERNIKVTTEKNMLISMSPAIAAAFHASTAVSLHNGVSHQMCKVGSKRRRTTEQVRLERNESKMKDDDLQKKLSELKSFENQLALQKNEMQNGKEAMAIINSMLKAGQVKQEADGSWTVLQPSPPKKK